MAKKKDPASETSVSQMGIIRSSLPGCNAFQ